MGLTEQRSSERSGAQIEVGFLSGHASTVNPFGFSDFSPPRPRSPSKADELSRLGRGGRARQMDSSSSAVPSPVAALMRAARCPARRTGAAICFARLRTSGQVHLVQHDQLRARRQLGIVERRAPCSSPRSRASGVRPRLGAARPAGAPAGAYGRGGAGSGRPSPAPACAPSMRPGMSATTNDRSPDSPTVPRFGHQRRERVVGDLGAGARRCARSATTCRRSGSRAGPRRRAA